MIQAKGKAVLEPFGHLLQGGPGGTSPTSSLCQLESLPATVYSRQALYAVIWLQVAGNIPIW